MSVLVGRPAPDFTVSAVLGNGEIVNNFNLYTLIRGKYALIFFYPLDFTFVCPSELIAIDHRFDEFQKRGIEVVAVSVDSQYSHHAYRSLSTKEGGIGAVKFVLASDVAHGICRSYGIEHPTAGVAFRATFLIDKNGIVRSEIVNDLPFGRNLDEILRLYDAIQFHDENGEVCPAGWEKGKASIKATPQGIVNYLSQNADKL